MSKISPAEFKWHVFVLQEWLKRDPDGVEWARLKLKDGGDVHAKTWNFWTTLENSRWQLTNNVLKPFVDFLDAAGNDKGAINFPEIVREAAAFPLGDLVRATLPFDRANALFCMKLSRTDPECPSGFMWVTETDLEAMSSKPAFNDQAQSFSITRRYLRASTYMNKADAEYVVQMIKPMAPKWMGLDLPTIEMAATALDAPTEQQEQE